MNKYNLLEIGLGHYLTVAAIIFSIAIAGLFMRKKSAIHLIISIELILIACSINFVAFSSYLGNIEGQITSLLILAIAAAKTAIGLAIFVIYFRRHGNINNDEINKLT